MATESDNVNSGALGTLLAVGTIAFFGIALVVTALVRSEMAAELSVKEVSADRPFRDLIAEQTAKLNAPPAYTDRNRGLVSLPIDRAMEVTVTSLKADPNSATPPAPVGGSGGAAAEATAGGAGGTGGANGGTGAEGEKPADEAVHAEGAKPTEPEKPEEKKGEKKKPAPHVQPVPAAPAPAPAAPAPAPAPATAP